MREVWVATEDLEPGATTEASDYVVEWQIHPNRAAGPAGNAAGEGRSSSDEQRRWAARLSHPSMSVRSEN